MTTVLQDGSPPRADGGIRVEGGNGLQRNRTENQRAPHAVRARAAVFRYTCARAVGVVRSAWAWPLTPPGLVRPASDLESAWRWTLEHVPSGSGWVEFLREPSVWPQSAQPRSPHCVVRPRRSSDPVSQGWHVGCHLFRGVTERTAVKPPAH